MLLPLNFSNFLIFLIFFAFLIFFKFFRFSKLLNSLDCRQNLNSCRSHLCVRFRNYIICMFLCYLHLRISNINVSSKTKDACASSSLRLLVNNNLHLLRGQSRIFLLHSGYFFPRNSYHAYLSSQLCIAI